jgi:3-phenylpropionate/trans-cinnamate dioxygenase ferredoxin subunit
MSDWVDVGNAADIQVGTSVEINIDGTSIAVFRLIDAFHAIEDICTHDGGKLLGGCVDHDQIVCPRHGARFSIVTGDVLGPPAYEPVTTFPVRVLDGIVQVRDDRWD